MQGMKLLILISSYLVFCQAAIITNVLKKEWEHFKNTSRHLFPDIMEHRDRLHEFVQNKLDIIKHNELFEKGEATFKMAVNKFAALTHKEFLLLMHLHNLSYYISGERENTYFIPDNVFVPDEIDWRRENAVTLVKDQRRCGSCWAFSAVGAIEGHQAIKTGQLVTLSEQNLIDCSGEFGTNGCRGGWMMDAFTYVTNNSGIDTEESYPYEETESFCRYDSNKSGATITGYKSVPPGDEEQLRRAVGTVGPVTVAIDATHRSLQFYSEGIYHVPICRTRVPSHAVLVVGYGTDKGHDYWLLKNSWGTSWGEDGYFRIARNRRNHCGIATWASYPTL